MKNQWFLRRNLLARLSLAVGLLTSATILSTNAAFIVNGSFESPAHSPGFYTGVPDGWFLGMGASTYTVNNIGGAYSSYPQAQHGNQYVVMTANPDWSLNQTFTLPTAGTYQFSWYDILSPSYSYVVSLYQGSNPNPIYSSSFQGASASFGAWVLRSREEELLAGSYTLQFRTGSGGAALFWDNVSVETSTVPEPSSMIVGALLLLPFAASTFRILKKRLPRSS